MILHSCPPPDSKSARLGLQPRFLPSAIAAGWNRLTTIAAYAGAAITLCGQAAPAAAQTPEILQRFNLDTNFALGGEPIGKLFFDDDGTMYGVCSSGGSGAGFGGGTVWKRTAAGVVSQVAAFSASAGAGGRNPLTGLLKAGDGNFYGPTQNVVTSNLQGAIYRLTPASVLSGVLDLPMGGQFNNISANPWSQTVAGPGGVIYGSTASGGTGWGTVWRIAADGTFSTIVEMTGTNPPDGARPGSNPRALAVTGDGTLYFIARKWIYRRTTDGTLTQFLTLNETTQGEDPLAMVTGADGNLYGIIRVPSVSETKFFRLTTTGVFTVLQTLPPGQSYAGRGELIQGSDGFFYTVGGVGSAGSPIVPIRLSVTGGYREISKPETNSGNATGLAEGPGGYIYGTLADDNTADSSVGGALIRFEITDTTPVITGTLTANAQTGAAFSYTITASDAPESFTAMGLPSGLNVNTSTGVISGTPTVGTGVYNVTLTATNALGTSPPATLVITVTNPGDVLLPGLDATGVVAGTTSTNIPPRPWFTQTAVSHDGTDAVQSGGPLNRFSSSDMSVTLTGPATVSFWWKTDSVLNDDAFTFSLDFLDQDTISGPDTPWRKVILNVAAGSHTLRWSFTKIAAVSGGQNAGWVDELLIESPDSAPVFVNESTTTASYASQFSFRVVATDVPTTYAASGLPPGLTFNTTTGVIAGTPSAAGIYTVSLSATNSFGTTSSTLTLTVDVVAGTLDTAFNPNLGNTSIQDAREVSVLPDGKLMVSGEFLTVGGISRPKLARLHANGSLDTGFAPGLTASNTVSHTEVLPNGKLVITGGFSSIGGGSRNSIAMLNADGTIDPSLPELTPLRNGETASLSTARIQKDGKLIVSGSFFSLGGLARQEIARLNSDYTPDAFNPNAGGLSAFYKTINFFEDGKLFLSGDFRTIGATARHKMARLTVAGVDDGFISQMTAFGICRDAAITPDGSVLAGRDENSGLLSFVRYLPNGTLDPTFTLPLSVTATVGQPVGVTSIATQCDGKIIIGGDFTSINGVPAVRLARLHPNGAIDTTFSASANTTRPFSSDVPGTVNDVSIQADGRVVVAGNFLDINGQQRHRIARLLNDPATQSFSATTSRIEWLRGGSSPEADWVSFEQSLDAGVSWTHLGFGTRIGGGWELTGLSLPAGAQLRGLARTRFGLIDSRLAGPAPEIAVEQPVGTGILDGAATITYPLDYVGTTSAPRTALVRNRGSAPLTITGVNIAGTHPGDYAIASLSLPMTLVPEGAVQISVTFTPTAESTRTAVLQIVTNDTDESPFDISLTGTGKVPPNSPPEITSPLTASATVPNFFSYQITATDEPSSYAATGLPPGLSVSDSSGEIFGTPLSSGVYNVQISATNAGFGTGPASTLVITVTNPGDALREPLDNPTGNFQAPGAAPWFSQTAVSHDGVDAVRSGAIGNFGSVSFTATVTGPAIASWWWRTDSETTNDYLRVRLNTVEKGRISGPNGAWTRMEIPIPNGNHTITFTYLKNGSVNVGADAGWVDELSISPPTVAPALTLTSTSVDAGSSFSRVLTTSQPFASMTATGLPAGVSLNSSTGSLSGTGPTPGTYVITVTTTNQAGSTTSDFTLTSVNPYLTLVNAIELPASFVPEVYGAWTAQTAVTHDGVDAITASPNWFDSARITFPIQGPATFSCWWKVNSGDVGNFAWITLDTVDGPQIATISAQDSAWQSVEYAVPAGSHSVIVLIYRGSDSFASAATLWLDQVSIAANSPDADTDGLPDAWEITHFGSAGTASGTDDSDNDGLNNFGEYAFGRDPKNGDLSGLPQATVTGGLLTLTVTKQPYVAYTVVGSPDLASGSFTTAGLTVVTDNATTLTVQETAAGTRRFLKVQAVPAP